MKVYISVDYEGITGIVSWNQETELRDEVRRRMTREVNAAIEGALEAGASRILVNDAHNDMRNLIPEELNEAAGYICGYPKPMCMVEGIGAEYDAAFFIGYHAAVGTERAVLDHTYSVRVFSDVQVNGLRLGETGLNAAVCGSFGVPVALVTGDDRVCSEAETLMPWVTSAQVKRGIGRHSAESLHPEAACGLIRERARESLADPRQLKPLVFDPPVELRIEFSVAAMADVALLIPGTKRPGPKHIVYTAPDYLTCYRVMRAMAILGGSSGIE